MNLTPKTYIAILNWKQYEATRQCLQSVTNASLPENTEIYLLDNESNPDELNKIKAWFHQTTPNYQLHTTDYQLNLGFAKAYNVFFDKMLGQGSALGPKDSILILNNDTIVTEGFVQKMISKINTETKTEMIACQMKLMNKEIDNLGVTMYRSGIAAPKTRENQKLFCPSGGAALYTIRLLRTLKEKTGHYFDADFFCYTEDVDLGYRARLLGFQTGLASDAIIYHHRTLSTGSPFNDFVLYHGIRNTLYSTIKNTPLLLLFMYSPYIILAHLAVIGRSLTQRKLSIAFRIYFHFLKALPSLLKKRHHIQKNRVTTAKQIKDVVTPQFFEPEYLKFCIKTLFQSPEPHRTIRTPSSTSKNKTKKSELFRDFSR